MRYPKGAIKSIEEFEALVKGKKTKALYWVVYVDNEGSIAYTNGRVAVEKCLLEELTAFGKDSYEHNRYSVKFTMRQWWTPITGFYFPIGDNERWFVFENYWMAYAYKCRLEAKIKGAKP